MSSTNRVLAGPPGDACFNRGVQHTGTPAGKTEKIGGIPTYVSEPPSSSGAGGGEGKKVILYLADVYGPFYLNNQLVQDYFAEGGFHVLGIDYFDGDPVHKHTEADFDRSAWMANAKKRAGEWVPKWFKAVKEIYGSDAKYCAVGYCFGGPHALGFANSDEFVAAAFAHPAFLNEDHFRTIKKPLFLSCAETDHTFPLESRRRAEDILVEVKAKYYIQVFSGVKHGFAVRGDPEVGDEPSTSSKSSSKATKDKPAGEKKQKRPPSAYNLYIKNNSAKWKEENPGKKQSEMMKEMAVLWKDADENPNKGREPKPKKKKSDSARATVAKDAASSSPPPSSPGLASSDD
ncbi:hypothetical protein D9758_013509 [Tetrapyrgos nigripes]|uniref:HMG box domain-containing protein n=1 Tax=Tetrapyrgos nigripes TaxID=182062 RepID=A0A8H5D1K9_9AGAR|nr:hypothetical protein D9758_013509 [Tetrapyrgos nigripes]